MLTIFACPKPFSNPHTAIIQRNGIRSWTLLRPRPNIVLMGDDCGVADVASELGVSHVAGVNTNEFGTPLLDDMISKVRQKATGEFLCYVNCDMILMDDFAKAVEQLEAWPPPLLLVGSRWALDISSELEFDSPGWQDSLRQIVAEQGQLGTMGIDYFAFSRDLYLDVPSFAIGRGSFDSWLISEATRQRSAIVDGTRRILAVHQNHDYSHVVGGEVAVWYGEEAKRNVELNPVFPRNRFLLDATHELTSVGPRRVHGRKLRHFLVQAIRKAVIYPTSGVRHRIGLRRSEPNRG